jgi:thioredoxin-related protein
MRCNWYLGGLLLLVLTFCVEKSFSQQSVNFENSLSWKEIQEKAKREDKFLFVDCFATWCGPCKEMDKNVYPVNEVGTFVNQNFIAVKVQLDSTAQDSETIKKWYKDAEHIRSDYKVKSLPTFLFFSPDGRLVHEGRGAQDVKGFLRVAQNALDSNEQYYTLLEKYKMKMLAPELLPLLAHKADILGGRELAVQVANDYKIQYLDRLPASKQITVNFLMFITDFPEIVHTDDKFFKFFFSHPEQADSMVKFKGVSDRMLSFVIDNDIFNIQLWKKERLQQFNPNWKNIKSEVTRKLNSEYAERLVLEAQLRFYKETKKWKTYAEYRSQKIKKYPPVRSDNGVASDQWILNSDAWDVFLECDDKEVLNQALDWVNLAIALDQPKPNVQYLDTKANLLYKLGDVKGAIALETKAMNLDTNNGVLKTFFGDEYKKAIDKMVLGEPTWPIN